MSVINHRGLVGRVIHSSLNKKDMIARQLSKSGRQIHCTFLGDRVTMGGSAITYMQGDLFLESINLKHGS